jgi:hypothetical protein
MISKNFVNVGNEERYIMVSDHFFNVDNGEWYQSSLVTGNGIKVVW